MNSVTVRLAGGLGNQLFQLFSAIFCVRKSLKTQIILDSRFLSSYETKMQLEIGFVLNVMHGFSIKNTPNFYMGFLSKFRVARLIDRCFFRFALLSSSKKLKDFNCKKYHYVILDGYFQDPELISRRQVTSIFKLLVKKNNYLKPISDFSETGYVAIHIRRGDYISSKAVNIFNTIPLNFYRRAIELFPLGTKFLVFGDSAEINHDFSIEINGLNVSTLNLSLSEEFMLLAMADHYVIANSTFSWWAAYFGYNKSKRVISPRNWYVDQDRSLNNPLLMKYFELLD